MATQQSLKVDDSSTPDASEKKGGGKHRRNYQACEPCRERKVKCDLGNVDNPLPPPCAKCKREQKECWFRDTRKKEGAVKEEAPPAKRRRTDSAHSHTSFAPLPVSPQISQNYTYQNPLSPARPYAPNALPNTPPLPGLSYATQPRSTPGDYRTPPNGSVPLYKKQDDVWGTKNTSAGFQQPLRNGDDHVVMPHASSLNRPFTNTTDNMSVLISAAKSTEAAHNTADRAKRTHSLMGEPLQTQGKPLSPSEAKARLEARKVWSNVKFVKAGWFSPDEALDYIKFFYTKLAPMTPVRVQEFADPSQHDRLLKEEPVLALAILAITSRYMEFNHPSKVGRGYYVHEKLWNSLQKIVQRLLWGQEQFGGGFTGAGNVHTQQSATGQITWKGSLRTLGTIEALLLLTDWQPRALHFPPGDDENKLVGGTTSLMEEDIATPAPSANIPYATWLEPAWRSDRMSWMLLGLAVHLGHELAVFDRSHEICKMDHSEQSDCMRRRRVRRLIITYVSQISGRIGIQPSLAPNYDKEDSRAPDADTPDDVMQKLWFQIAHIMYDANQDIFPTHEKTAEYIENGHYKNLIGGFAPRLRSWLNKFDNAKPQLDPMMANVLRMEYEYARLYIHSLGLQKVVGEMATQNRSSIGKGFSSQLGSVYDDNKVYIDEVRSAARAILECSCYGIGNHNALGYAPVRTFLRALSALMFSLKVNYKHDSSKATLTLSSSCLSVATKERSVRSSTSCAK